MSALTPLLIALLVIFHNDDRKVHASSYKKFTFEELNHGSLYPATATEKQLRSAGGLNCHYRNQTGHERFIQCQPGATCYSVVDVVYNRGLSRFNRSVTLQGCWSEKNSKWIQEITHCNDTKCHGIELTDNPEQVNDNPASKLFCCCSQGLCNHQIHMPMSAHPHPTQKNVRDQSPSRDSNHSVAIIASIAGSFLLLTICAIWFCHYKKKQQALHRHFKKSELLHISSREESQVGNTAGCLLEVQQNIDLKTLTLIGEFYQSKNATVRMYELNGKTVAVKIFPKKSPLRWHNEKETYQMLGPHPNVTRMIAYGILEKEADDPFIEGYIILEYHPHGTLQNYLRNVTLSWLQMIKMAYSLANGLAYVHGDLQDKQARPFYRGCVAHRDLNNRNVLVKADGSCCLSDFGHALCIMGDCPIPESQMRQLATNSATSRMYMAPELFTQSLSMSEEWGSSLKQVDCYALGLLIWEIAVRCRDIIVPGEMVPVARLPFESELGSDPSMDELQQLVLVKNLRPSFPQQWITNDFTVTHLRAIITTLWDEEEGTRLTALCAMNRIAQIKNITSTEQSAILDIQVCLDYNSGDFHMEGVDAVSLLDHQHQKLLTDHHDDDDKSQRSWEDASEASHVTCNLSADDKNSCTKESAHTSNATSSSEVSLSSNHKVQLIHSTATQRDATSLADDRGLSACRDDVSLACRDDVSPCRDDLPMTPPAPTTTPFLGSQASRIPNDQQQAATAARHRPVTAAQCVTVNALHQLTVIANSRLMEASSSRRESLAETTALL